MKKLSIAALVAIIAICLSACGSEPTKTASVKPKPVTTATATATPDPLDPSTTDTDGDGVFDQFDVDPADPDVTVAEDDDSAPTEDEDAPTEDAAGNQTVKSIGQWGEDDDMKVKVVSMEKVNYIPAVNEYSDPVNDKSGSSLVAVKVEVKNNGNNDIDPLCGGGNGFVLLDQDDRNFDPLDSLLDINDNVCGDGIQPGFKSTYTIAYRLPAGSKIGGLVVWNSDADDYDGEESELLFTA
jgi:hypothetical protein